jgi:WhiB family redox-sensing transcriptional regulator
MRTRRGEGLDVPVKGAVLNDTRETVARLWADGLSAVEIAERLNLNRQTIHYHLHRMGVDVDRRPRREPLKSQPRPRLVERQPQREDDWRVQGACWDTADPVFFPDVGGGKTNAAQAKSICQDCAVTQQCLDYSLATKPRWGVWGGTVERERRNKRRDDRRTT